jgi:hypothetical protein
MSPNNQDDINSNSTTNKISPILISLSAIAVIGGGVALAAFLTNNPEKNATNNNESSTASTSSPTPSSNAVATTSIAAMQMYKNGNYSGKGTYNSPGGEEKVNITIKVEKDIIVEANFTGITDNPTSKQYQNIFSSNYKSLVIGKNIDSVNLSKVSGSSLTSSGFNEALAEIKNQSKI